MRRVNQQSSSSKAAVNSTNNIRRNAADRYNNINHIEHLVITQLADQCHNHGIPCCQKLFTLTKDEVFPELGMLLKRVEVSEVVVTSTNSAGETITTTMPNATTTTTTTAGAATTKGTETKMQEPSFFAMALREHLLLQHAQHKKEIQQLQRQDASDHNDANENLKKKRKKKKKKKGAGATTAAATIVAAATGEDGSEQDNTTVEESEHAATALPTARNETTTATTPAAAAASTTNNSNDGKEKSGKDHDPSITTTTTKTKSAIPSFKRRVIGAFLDRMLSVAEEEKRQGQQQGNHASDVEIGKDPSEGSKSDSSEKDNNKGRILLTEILNPSSSFASFKSTFTLPSGSSKQPQEQQRKQQAPVHCSREDVDAAIENIHCKVCRDKVKNILNVKTTVEVLPVCMSASSMKSPSFEQHEQQQQQQTASSLTLEVLGAPPRYNTDDAAFDYVAMEEGNGTPYNPKQGADAALSTFAFEFLAGDSNEARVGWQLRKREKLILRKENEHAELQRWGLKSDQDEYSEILSETFEWTKEDLDFLVEDYLLLASVHPTMLVEEPPINSNSAYSLISGIETRYTTTQNEFNACREQVEEQIKKMNETLDPFGNSVNNTMNNGGGGNIDMTSLPIMKEADEVFCAVMAQLMRLLLDITRSYQSILSNMGGPSVTRQNAMASFQWAHEGILTMWEAYMKCLNDMLVGVCNFERQLFGLADGTTGGGLPQMFVSSTARSLYRKLVDIKRVAVLSAIDNTQSIVDRLEPVETLVGHHWSTNFLRKIFLYEQYHQFMAKSTCVVEGKCLSAPLPIDVACADLLKAAREWSETVHQGSIQKILDSHSKRRDKLVRLLGNADQEWNVIWESIDTEDGSAGDASYLLALRQDLVSLQEASDKGDDPVESLRELRLRLIPAMNKAIRLWIGLRMSYNIDGYESEAVPFLPYQLARWIAKRHNESCQHTDGTVRAACILVSLFFRWLSDRCKEWQAYAAEQELLLAMEMLEKKETSIHANSGNSTAAAAATSAAASSKKSKKKRDKKAPENGKENDNKNKDTKKAMNNGKEHDNKDTKKATSNGKESGNNKNKKITTTENGNDSDKNKKTTTTENGNDGILQTQQVEVVSMTQPTLPAVVDTEDFPSKNENSLRPEKPKSWTDEARHAEIINEKAVLNGHSETTEGDQVKAAASDVLSSASKVTDKTETADHASNEQAFAHAVFNWADLDASITMGVHDYRGFQSAEKYLARRLQVVMDSLADEECNVIVI